MSSDVVIEIEGLTKCFDLYARPIDRLFSFWKKGLKQEFWALRQVSFTVHRSETVGVIGQNGSGKSTLLQCICGTLQPTEGVARVHGRIAALLELGAGFDLESTGRENVFINGFLLGMKRSEIELHFASIEKFADIGGFIDQPVKTYSSGMYVRLAFAVIAHSNPDILIIDEALAVGDVYFVQKCMRFIREFKKRGTILFVSHDTAAVTSLCDRAVWLHDGQLRMQGSAKEVSERYLAYQHAKDRLIQTGDDVRFQHEVEAPDMSTVNSNACAEADCRQELRMISNLRNDIGIVDLAYMTEEVGFGTGKARIIKVLMMYNDMQVRMVYGGELVTLIMHIMIHEELHDIIAGFYFKDRLGQRLFGDNTYLSYYDCPVQTQKGQTVEARFEFRMPILPVGDYSIDVAFASGHQHDHTQHHWIHDAVTFQATASGIATGLVGIPMTSINLIVLSD